MSERGRPIRETLPKPESRLCVVETNTREAIKEGKRTIAYIAIGAEAWGPLLAAAPEKLALVRPDEIAIKDPSA